MDEEFDINLENYLKNMFEFKFVLYLVTCKTLNILTNLKDEIFLP